MSFATRYAARKRRAYNLYVAKEKYYRQKKQEIKKYL